MALRHGKSETLFLFRPYRDGDRMQVAELDHVRGGASNKSKVFRVGGLGYLRTSRNHAAPTAAYTLPCCVSQARSSRSARSLTSRSKRTVSAS